MSVVDCNKLVPVKDKRQGKSLRKQKQFYASPACSLVTLCAFLSSRRPANFEWRKWLAGELLFPKDPSVQGFSSCCGPQKFRAGRI